MHIPSFCSEQRPRKEEQLVAWTKLVLFTQNSNQHQKFEGKWILAQVASYRKRYNRLENCQKSSNSDNRQCLKNSKVTWKVIGDWNGRLKMIVTGKFTRKYGSSQKVTGKYDCWKSHWKLWYRAGREAIFFGICSSYYSTQPNEFIYVQRITKIINFKKKWKRIINYHASYDALNLTVPRG